WILFLAQSYSPLEHRVRQEHTGPPLELTQDALLLDQRENQSVHSRSNYAQFLHLLSASRRFTLNQLGNEGAREFFWKRQALLQDMEHFDSTRSNVEGIKAHGGK